jgi:hypothetical protein
LDESLATCSNNYLLGEPNVVDMHLSSSAACCYLHTAQVAYRRCDVQRAFSALRNPYIEQYLSVTFNRSPSPDCIQRQHATAAAAKQLLLLLHYGTPDHRADLKT